MRLAVFGATGGTGRSLVEQALDVEDKVTVLARRPAALGELAERVEVVEGDVLDPAAVGRVVAGADVVISTLGIRSRWRDTDVYSRGVANIIDAMGLEGTGRLLVVSRARGPHADMALMEQRVRACGLDWTLVRAARLTNGPVTGGYRTSLGGRLRGAWSISRPDLAHFLLSHAMDAIHLRGTVEIAY